MSIDRRTFLKTTGAALAGAAAGRDGRERRPSAGAGRWKKAFMLGGVTKGPVLPDLPAPQGGRLRGGRADQPQPARPRRGARRARQDRAWSSTASAAAGTGKSPSPTPTPRSSSAGMAAIRQEFLDCKAYGGTTVLVVPAVVNKKVSYRDAYDALAGEHPQADPLRREGRGQDRHRGGLEQVPAQPRRVRPLHRRVQQPLRSAPTSTSATSSSTATPRSGSASWASGSSRSTSRNTPSPSGSTTSSARARSTGPPSARP